MLLRRITEHVRAQNWIAIGIDFMIVVIGVFIGIQVANWNDLQEERIRAEDHTGRCWPFDAVWLGEDAPQQSFDQLDGPKECVFGAAWNANGGGRRCKVADLAMGRAG